MPVTVDLPLVPATPIAGGAALNSCGEQFGAASSARAPTRRARRTSGTVVLDRGGGDDDLVGAR